MGTTRADFYRALEGVEGESVLKPPLSAQQIQSAVKIGKRFYTSAEALSEDPYTQWLPDTQAMITLGTVFGRIAAYSGVCARTGESPNPGDIERLNLHPVFQTHYQMQSISSHKSVSCIVIDGPSRMEYVERSRLQDGFNQTWAFPYPPYLGVDMSFEVLVPKFLIWGPRDRLNFGFGRLR